MRLIDADELPIDDYKYIHRHTIITAPTVEAIPIEWINKWLDGEYNKQHLGTTKTYVWEMVADWEAENDVGNR